MIKLQTPEPIKAEHQAFHEELLKAIKSGGEVEKIAKQIDNILNPHFKIEEESAFPPLSLMAPLSQEEIDSSMKDALDIIERLKYELPKKC
jgi:hemerythrin superfamily protein